MCFFVLAFTCDERGVHDELLRHVQDGQRRLGADAESLELLHARLDTINLELFVREVLHRFVVDDAVVFCENQRRRGQQHQRK